MARMSEEIVLRFRGMTASLATEDGPLVIPCIAKKFVAHGLSNTS
jgi:hypothetical protein